jgi:three-Cys-motif partner protein
MSKNDFFAERKEQSRIKIEIVNKYFAAWWKILLPSVESRGEKLGYIDLFSGPGLYKDGNKSTPILLL